MDNPLLRDLTNQIPFFHDIPPNPAYFQLSRRADVEKGIFFFLFSFFFFSYKGAMVTEYKRLDISCDRASSTDPE